jgi:EAL domain-containing protein (putative c-di-GMP-specific phosphodiesterase class I)
MFHADAALVRRVLHAESIHTHFQPLVSLRRGTVFGVEALSRGTDPKTKALVPPADLFAAAAHTGARLALDRLCRKRALEAFRPLYERDPALLLSLNVDASVIDASCVHSRVLDEQVKQAGIPPENVAIEIIESRAGGALALMEFVADYKRRGYVVALDDFGAGHSNLDRIHLLKPDLIKLDRTLISRIDRHFHKQEVVKSFVRLAGRTGCMVLGEGVERLEEALTLLECGVDVFQGFFFARPEPAAAGHGAAQSALAAVAEAHKRTSIRRYNAEKIRFAGYHALVERICARLGAIGASQPEHPAGENASPTAPACSTALLHRCLAHCLEEDPRIECLYLLDAEGVQISETICRPERVRPSRRLLYEPARRGTDHSCKEYFLPLRSGMTRFTSEPYLSLASGRRCITIAAMFMDREGMARILCIDLMAES